VSEVREASEGHPVGENRPSTPNEQTTQHEVRDAPDGHPVGEVRDAPQDPVGGSPGSGPQTQLPPPPPPPRPLPPTPTERGGVRALFLSMVGLLLLLMIPELAIIGIAMLVAGVVNGVRARRRARRILTRAPGAIPGIVIGAIGLCLCAAGAVLATVAAEDLGNYQKCRGGALTITDKQACQDTYLPKIEHKLHLPKGSLDHYRSMM
jgi:hypothetical protein